MFGQMIRTTETFGTNVTLVGLDARVRSLVSRQFIRTREFPSTVGPGTVKRFLSCVTPEVRLEMGALAVDFVAVWVGARVDLVVQRHAP